VNSSSEDTSALVPVYHVDPTLIGPEGGSLPFRDDSLDVADDVRIDIPLGALYKHIVFWIRGFPNDSLVPPGTVVGGVYEITPDDTLPCVEPLKVTLKYHWSVPEQLNMFRKLPNGTWERVLTGRFVQTFGDSLGTISVDVTRLGLFAILVDSSATGVGGTPQPQVFALLQSYPNPFNPYCKIRYEVPRAGKVGLRVFDVRGSLVRIIVDGWREPGTYSEVWDGRNDAGKQLSSGVYFYRLDAIDFVATRKMVLIH
jgi:hypothetical protein